MGDAHMRPEDARAGGARGDCQPAAGDRPRDRSRSSRAGAAHPRGAGRAPTPSTSARTTSSSGAKRACAPRRRPSRRSREVLGPTPVPGLGPGLGAMPRFRAEVGPFIGFAGSGDARIDRRRLPAFGHRQGRDRRRRPVGARGPGPGRRDRRVGRRPGVRVDRAARRLGLDQRSTRHRHPRWRRPAAWPRSGRASASPPGCACRST